MKKLVFILFISCIHPYHSLGQAAPDSLTALILHLDSSFWNAYNNCDTNAIKNYFTENLEFYHDKGGVTLGASALTQSLAKNLCSNVNYHLRREAVPGTVKVYPMENNNVIYGAVITGEHLFYITQNNNPEFVDGDADFTHLWILKDGVWKMSRILSYNHHQATYRNMRKEVQLSNEQLNTLTGVYKSDRSGKLQLKREAQSLILYDDKNSYTLYPQSATSFFTKDRDLVFDFALGAAGKPVKMTVKEHGAVADELLFVH
jgi:Domain of unknown function (DUF4440)